MPISRLRLLATTVAMTMVVTTAIAAPPPSSRSSRPARPARTGVFDLSQRIDVNDLSMSVTNFGSFAYDMTTGQAGLEFPRGSGKTVVFAGGLWLGAKVNGSTRLAIAEYSSEYAPGAMIGGSPDDPDDVSYKVYKLTRTDPNPTVLADYQAGAVPHGAPPVTVLPDNTLDIPGDQMLWSVYNDADPARHTHSAGQTQPLGVEVQQTSWAFDDPGPLGRTIYMTFKIINKGANVLDSLRVGLWADPDLGGIADDLTGSVWHQPLGYAYNATNNDFVYGALPPAVGVSFLQGYQTVYTPSFVAYGNGTDPVDAEQAFLSMQGRMPDGTPISGELGTRFMFTGDPITGTGWLDVLPQDRRMLLCIGLAPMAPGDTVTTTWAVVVGQENDRLSSVARLRCDTRSIKDYWLSSLTGSPPRPTRFGCDDLPSCPRSSGWWADQFGPAHDFTPQQVDTISRRVDFRSTYFDWGADPVAGFSQLFQGPETDRRRAEREFASLHATMSAFLMIPPSGFSVILHNVEVACDGLEAESTFELAETATSGLTADYLDLNPANPVPIAGVAAGGAFGGGAFTGFEFFGSAPINPVDHPDSFPRVELRFGGTQLANRYLRFETPGGNIPPNYPNGRGYVYAGRRPVPFTAWDADHNVQLEVGFVERVIVDDNGTIQPAEFQLATFDSAWSPTTDTQGGREYLTVFSYPYGGGASELTTDFEFADGHLPIVYVLWSKRVSEGSVFDNGDVFYFEWGPVGPSVDALMLRLAELPPEQADPVYQQIVNCLSQINRGIGIGPTCDLETAVAISLIQASATEDGISVAWYATEAVSVAIERRVGSGEWTQVASRTSDGSGRITYDDRDVTSGHRYGYRLRYNDGGERIAGETSLDLPSTARVQLRGFAPNPARGRPGVAFSLASDHPATLTIHDIAGRRVGSWEVGRFGRGAHLLQLDQVSLASGVYLLRLTQDGRTLTARSALVR